MLQDILQSPEYQEYRDELGHVESEADMSDLEVNEPQLFNTLKKAKRKHTKRSKGRRLTRKVQPAPKVKRLKLRIQQPASIPTTLSNDHHLAPAAQASFPPSIFQGPPLRSSLPSIGPSPNLSSSVSELAHANKHQVSMFQVNIPERGYHITPSQNPKRRTIFEAPQYTDNGNFSIVNRTYELVQKNVVPPTWSALPLENDLASHDQQLPAHSEEPTELFDSEMAEVASYLLDEADDLFFGANFDVDMNEDGASK